MSQVGLFLSKLCVPSESNRVRQQVEKAGIAVNDVSWYTAHITSTSHVIVAIAVSVLNVPTYLTRGVYRFSAHVIVLDIKVAVKGLGSDLAACLQSGSFVLVGVVYVAFGILFPRTVFAYFVSASVEIAKPGPQPSPGKGQGSLALVASTTDGDSLDLGSGPVAVVYFNPNLLSGVVTVRSPRRSVASRASELRLETEEGQILPQLNRITRVLPIILRQSHENASRMRVVANSEEGFELVSRRENPQESWLAYVQQQPGKYTLEIMANFAKTWGHLMAMLQSPDKPETAIPVEKRAQYMAPFVWFLMYLAQMRGAQAFEQGMIVFQDPGHRIHDFFAAAAGKQRDSSHYRGRRVTSYEIPITQDGVSGLPGGNRTSHFGQLPTATDPKNQYTFLKPESWPVRGTPGQFAMHAVEYAFALVNHARGCPTGIGELKEHPPSAITKNFAHLFSNKSAATFVKNYGIAAMIKSFRDLLVADSNAPEKGAILEFAKSLPKRHTHSLIRKGEEVILEDIFSIEGNREERERLNAPLQELIRLAST